MTDTTTGASPHESGQPTLEAGTTEASPAGGTAEVRAELDCAEAELSGFRQDTADYTLGRGPAPDWMSWSQRLAHALGGLLALLDGCAAATATSLTTAPSVDHVPVRGSRPMRALTASQWETLHDVFADAMAYHPGRSYRTLARDLGIDPWGA